MATTNLTKDTFKSFIEKKEGIQLIDWWATWCPPCRAFAPVFEAASEKHKDLSFAKINTEEEGELAAAFAIQSIPTLMVFRDGILLFAEAGALPSAALEDLIAQVRKLDMNEVRKKVAEQKGTEVA